MANKFEEAISVPEEATGNESEPPGVPEVDKPVEGWALYCSDGDTCRIQVAGAMWMNVRLAGIDAPETPKGRGKKKKGGQPLGEAAQQFLNAKLQRRAIVVRQVDLDPYNRPVVEITLAGDKSTVNLALLEGGYAEMYRGKTKRLDKAAYAAAEEKARKLKAGIWGLKDYQSPAAYRKERREG
jgi:endonuclease YncB( thermonuclease family)